MWVAIFANSVSLSNGFANVSTAPSATALARSIGAAAESRKTTGRYESSLLCCSFAQTAYPSISGMSTSSRRRSGRVIAMMRSAVLPLSASITS